MPCVGTSTMHMICPGYKPGVRTKSNSISRYNQKHSPLRHNFGLLLMLILHYGDFMKSNFVGKNASRPCHEKSVIGISQDRAISAFNVT